MERITIMLPKELKNRAFKLAGEMGISMGQLIREALTQTLEKKRSSNEDSFFADNAVFRGDTPQDLAQYHDDYLYGDIP